MAELINFKGIFTKNGENAYICPIEYIEGLGELIAVGAGAEGCALEGDLVLAAAADGKASVTDIAARASGCIAGVLCIEKGVYVVRGSAGAVAVKDGLPEGCRVGDIVCAEVTDCKEYAVRKSFGAAADAEANLKAMLCAEGLCKPFSEDAQVQAKELAFTEISSYMAMRTDLRGKTVITLSKTETSRTECGFSVERDRDGNYVLGVHTVDAAEFIPTGSALERAVFSRGKTAVLPDREIPMLPDALSKGACFLEVGEDRLAVSYFLTINEDGQVVSFDFCESIIKTAANCLFQEIDALLFEYDISAIIPLRQAYASILPTIYDMFNLGGILQAARLQNGGADIDRAQRQFVHARHGNLPIGVVNRKDSDPERLVREFLAVAGMELASYLNRNNIPAIYRVQDAPSAESIADFRAKAALLGIDTSEVEDSAVFAYAAEYSHGMRTEELLLNTLHYVLPKTGFSATPKHHSVHNTDMYVRFAYPINRCADFCMQRIVKSIISARDEYTPIDRADMRQIVANGIACASVYEERAGRAEQAAEDIMTFECLARISAKDYKGLVAEVAETGLVCLLDNGCLAYLPIEGCNGGKVDGDCLVVGKKEYRYGSEISLRFDRVSYEESKLYVRL